MKKISELEVSQKVHIHLMGICGTAMASLAGLLKDRGFTVTGSDSNPYPPMSTQIEGMGIQILKGYKKENLAQKPDFVIVGNVISAANEEAQELVRLGIPYTSLPNALGELILSRANTVVVAGTHGKTTTTSLASWCLDQLGEQPGFLIGGIPLNFSQSYRNPLKEYFVIEGDEYDTAYFDKVPKFTHYFPKNAILTSIEFDHADIYRDLDHVKEAFKMLLAKIPENTGLLIYHADDANIRSILDDGRKRLQYSYGFNSGDYRISDLVTSNEKQKFNLSFQGKDLGVFEIPMSGEYNVLNSVAVIALLHQKGFSLEKLKPILSAFQGVKRRQEILGEPGGVLVIEDFAHHPTAVRETVKGIKAKYPKRNLFAVFEPRSATSRRKIFQKEYASAFKLANHVILAKAFDQAKLSEEDRFSSEMLVADLNKQGTQAECFDSVEEIISVLKAKTKSGDLVLIMSNGGFDGIYGKLLSALK